MDTREVFAGPDDRLDPYAGTDALSRAEAVRSAETSVADADRERAPGLSVVVLTLDRADLLVPLARFLLEEARPAFAERGLGLELVVGDTGSTDPELLSFYEGAPEGLTVVRDLDYHFARCNDRLFADNTSHEKVLFLNNDVRFPDGPGPLLAMWDVLEEEEAGIAGHLLHYPDGRIQHAGIDFRRWEPHRGEPHHPASGERWPAAAFSEVSRVPAVTGACLMVGASLFRRCGGFDPGYRAEWQDVDLCLRAHRLGEDTALVSAGEVVHLENATRPRGEEHAPDRRRLMRRWGAYVRTRFPDPLQA